MRVMRNAVRLVAVAATASAVAHAQTWPVKPIRIVVPFPAGGGVDFVGRVVAQKLGEQTGQTVVVARLQTEAHRMLAQADVRERLATQGFEPDPSTPEALATRIRTEIDKWTRVVRAANIRLE